MFEYYKARDGWRWRLKAPNGEIVATSEAYTRKADVVRSIESLATMWKEAPKVVEVIEGIPQADGDPGT